MAKLFTVKVQTQAVKEVKVVGETPEEAQAKVPVTEGETVVEVVDEGEVVS